MSTTALTTFAALIAVAMLVVVHEFGHFLAAKALGVRVLVFSIGFGKRLFGFEWRGTDYRVSSLPFGGYVRMSHADPFGDAGYDDGEGDDTPRSEWFSLRPAWQRLIIMFAGPFANLVLPFGLFTVLLGLGEPQPESVIGTVMQETPAHAAGVREGDRITAVDGEPVRTWVDIDDLLIDRSPETLRLTLDRGGAPVEVSLARDPDQGPGIGGWGVDSLAPDTTVGIDSPRSPAGVAGLATGDLVDAVDGVVVDNFNELQAALARAGETTTLRVYKRGGGSEPVELTLRAADGWAGELTPADDAVWARWGVGSATWFVGGLSEGDTVPARVAGVQPGDRMLSANGRPVHRFTDVLLAVSAGAEGSGAEQVAKPVELVVRRAGEVRTFTIQPQVERMVNGYGAYVWRPIMGIRGDGGLVDMDRIPRPYPVVEAFPRAVDITVENAALIARRVGEMVTLEAPVLDNLGGPVAMVAQARAAAELGPFALGRMVAGFSISLFVLNLLPIPVLDGGSIFMYVAEWLRGRPLPRLVQERAQQFGVVFLVLLTLVVFANDSLRLVKSWLLPG